MNFDRPNPEYKSERIEIKSKPKGLKEKIRHNIRKNVRKIALAGSVGASAIVGGYIANERIPRDYTEAGSFNSAFSKARKDGRKVFKWNNKSYEVKLVDKEFSDNYWESKKFLEAYYASNYFKLKYKEGDKASKERISNLKESTYFSITTKKNKEPHGFYEEGTNKVFISQKDKEIDKTLSIHELTHKATHSNTLLFNSRYNAFEKPDPALQYEEKFIEKWGKGGFGYLSDPTEIDARQNSVHFWLFKHFPKYTASSAFTGEQYDFLKENYEKLPYTIQQLLDLYPKKEVFINNMNAF